MSFLKQLALLALTIGVGLNLSGCQPSDSKAPKQPTLELLAVSPSSATVAISGTQALRVTGTFSDKSTLDLTSASTFASSATSVALVSSAGVVTAVKAGTATITATHTATGKTATASITVPAPLLVSIAATPAKPTLAVGATQALTVTATYNEGSTAVITSGLTYATSDPTVVTVNAAGVMAGVAAGTATITVRETASAKSTTAVVTVSAASGGGGGGGAFSTVTFDGQTVTYTGFGGAEDASTVTDPTGGTNKVAKVVKSATAEVWAGTTFSTGANDTVGKIPFSAGNTRMTVRVYSPAAGIKVRLKVENHADPTVSVETEATTTKVNTWETLTFDFASQAAGTAALDVTKTYDRASIFFDFGVAGGGTAKTYYFDDVTFVVGGASGGAFSTVTFDSSAVTYTFTGFGGAEDSSVAADPAGGANKVAKVVKSATAEVWAGTTFSTGANDTVGKIPFDASNKRMTVRVYSPVAGIKVRLKVEDHANPGVSVETEATTTKVNTWETLTFDFASQAAGTAALDVTKTYDRASIFFDFGVAGGGTAKTYYFDDVTFIGGTGTGGGGGAGGGAFSTVNFDSAPVTLTGFGGAEDSTVVTDPAGGTNKVGKVVKSATAELWAGTTFSTGANDTVGKIPFDAANTRMTVRVYSPVAGIKVRVKVEDHTDPTVSVETEATTTKVNTWETLTFDFASQAAGTAALNVAKTYDRASIFFDFGVTGATAGSARTYYFDDVTFIGGTGTGGGGGGGGGGATFSPVTFDSTTLTYTLTGFGGAEDSTVVADPVGGANKVAKVVKSATAELWAGTTVSTGANNTLDKIPFSTGNTRMTVRVYSPNAGIQVRLKLEDATDPTHSVETEATTTVANGWETLTFDFANQASGTAALNLAYTYNKVSIFFNFGVTGAAAGGAKTYYFDDVTFIGGTGAGGGGGGSATFTPITFDASGVAYTLTGFGGAEDSTVAVDPTNSANMVAKVVKSGTAELWAGTTVSTGANQSVDKVPFSAGNTKMTVRVYSPNAGIQVRLKLEDAADPTHSVETEATTTVANGWQTLTFDFANQASGTAALNLAFTYNKVSIFFNFGVTGAAAGGAKTYYFDDVTFIGAGSGGGGGAATFTPVTFDSSALTYTLTGFGGAEDSTVVADPTNAANKVARVVKSATAELWAGTTVSTGANLSVDKIPFSASKTKMTVRVYSPDAGIHVRLKVEDAADPTRSVETEATTTTANAWETLTFDFASQASGTAALNLAFTYNKASIFFNFGTTGAVAGAKTYYFDDLTFLP